jgi:Family of unknown function (DUF5906)
VTPEIAARIAQMADAALATPLPPGETQGGADGLTPTEIDHGPGHDGHSRAKTAPQGGGAEVIVGGIRRKVATFESLNRRFGLYEPSLGSSVWVCRNGGGPIQDSDLKRRLCNEVVQIGVDRDNRPMYRGAFQVLTQHAERHVYRSIDFTNKAVSSDTLNLYCGVGVTPREGKCELILKHLFEVICAGVESNFNALVDLFAWQIQHIGEPSRIIVLIWSKRQQAGKGVLGELLTSIYGPSGFTPSSSDQVFGRFNDSLRGRSFVFLDEALFGGDLRTADAVKQRATARAIGIEAKGLPVIQCPVAVNFLIASNHDCAAHIEEDDARYWVLEVSEEKIGDHQYFAALMDEIAHGGREAFAHYLLNLNVSEFVPWRDVPRENESRGRMIRKSFNPYDARNWLEECARSERFIGFKVEGGNWKKWEVLESDGKPFFVPFERLADAYRGWQAGVKSAVSPRPTHTAILARS